jgi:hypothetical protein
VVRRVTSSLNGVSLDVAGTPFLITAPLAVLWTGAALIADGLALSGSARAMRRRTTAMAALLGTGAAASVGAALAPIDVPAAQAAMLLLFGACAVAAATVALPRLRRLAAATGAFSRAPGTPASLALRAMAAHPLAAAPAQVVSAAALIATATAAGLWPPVDGAGMALAGTVLLLVTAVVGVRHALRHSRLAESALLPVHSVRLAPASLFTGGRPVDG